MLRPFQLNGFLVSAKALPSSVDLHSNMQKFAQIFKLARKVTCLLAVTLCETLLSCNKHEPWHVQSQA